MSHTLLGEVFQALGLLREDDVAAVMARVREGVRARFGEIAVEMGLLDDEAVARGLAQQFRLNMVPPDRLRRLSVAPEVLDLLPRGLVRERLILPTFMDEEKRVLSLLTADPTDIASLRAAQTTARAARLRLFVAPRAAMQVLIDRLFPPEEGEQAPRRATIAVEGDQADARNTVVFEPDPDRAAALRRLEAVEEGGGQIVGDLEQVLAFIEANQADRVFFRRVLLPEVEPHVKAWRKVRPMVQICALDGFGPGWRLAVPYDRTRDFFFGLLEHLIGVDAPAGRARGERTIDLVRAMAAEVELPAEQRDTVVLAAIFTEMADVSAQPETLDEAGRIAWAAELARPWGSPYDLQALFDALVLRVRGESGPGGHAGAELLYSARAAARLGVGGGDDLVAALGADAARHDAAALRALGAVLARLPARAPSPVERPAPVPPPPPSTGDEPTEASRASSLFETMRRMLGRSGSPPAMSGRLAAVPLVDVLQLFTNAGQTALVTVSGAFESGMVQVRDGRLVAAIAGSLDGEDALQALVSAREGRFEVRLDDGGVTNLSGATEFLMFDAVRRRDEARG